MGDEPKPTPGLKFCVNELLYFLQNAVNTLTRTDIVQICNNFYSDEEVEFAKGILWNRCEDTIKRYRTRNGPEMKVHNIADMYEAIKKLDWNICLIRFAAVQANKVPPFDSNKCDLCVIRNDLLDLKKSADLIKDVQKELSQVQLEMQLIKESQVISCDKFETVVNATKNLQSQTASNTVKSYSQVAQSNLAETSKKMPQISKSSTDWIEVRPKKSLIGKQVSTSIKVVRPKIVRYFHVTRLAPETTVEELAEYIKSKNVNQVDVEQLKAKFDTYASFKVKVTVSESSEFDVIYSDDFWPCGAMIRRFFVSKFNNGQKS